MTALVPNPTRVTRWSLAIGLLLLSPICAEYLIGYDASIGNPAELLAGLVILAPLYGAVAVLIREFTRRAGRGWPTMLLLSAAFGLVQAGLIDQSLFNLDLEFDVDDPAWATEQPITPIPGIGVDASQLLNFVGGHVIWSFAAPIAVMESLAPRAAHQPWLRWPGIAAMVVLYAIGAGVIAAANVEVSAPPAQLVGTGVVVAALVVAAFAVPHRTARSSGGAPPVWFVGGLTYVLLGGTQLLPTSAGWLGVAATVAALGVLGLMALRLPGRRAHMLAMAGGALLARATLAFLVEPLGGDVSDSAKLTMNAVILLGTIGLLVVAGRRVERT